jgi:hypothetical protein
MGVTPAFALEDQGEEVTSDTRDASISAYQRE